MLASGTLARTFAGFIRFLARTCSFCVRMCLMLPLLGSNPPLSILGAEAAKPQTTGEAEHDSGTILKQLDKGEIPRLQHYRSGTLSS